ncbi:cell wall metabolism sensor histidine kinase WalK [Enterococcus hermanniensis]|uniref:histidine kinase n=1 Tax=Enterococcus hermanniensis TaxID=249189 RepID=A0A1L8TRF1_9ENTE|nr:cell wall metabolism sensor histidine kinase WalK [Enterococcus hermanniensis]OJG46895.1 PAS domain two-component system sensor histidine kinase [Enterococcus hermanniensis]
MEKKVRFYRSVNFKVAFSFILILLISIELIGAYFIRGLERSTINSFTKDMNQRVALLSTTIASTMAENSENEATQLQRILENNTAADIKEMWVVDDKGIVLATNDVGQKDSVVGKKNDSSDIADFSLKQYVTLDDNNQRVYINVQPIQSPTGDSAVIGALYVKSNIEQKYTEISNTALIFFTASVIAGLISIIVALLVARSITKPIKEMQKQAMRIAQGDYSEKVEIHGHDELSQLAETFNKLSDRVEDAQDTMEAERNRLDSVLTHMTDGVIATDRRGKVITINEMALSLLDMSNEEAIGQSILTLLDLEEEYTLRKLLEAPGEILIDRSKNEEDRITLRSDFAMIRRESGFISGLVVVLHDVTEQEKTAEERRQFVSNVSHELRTPLTSVRSYLEALEEGAWQDENIAPNFIQVTLGETDRMIRMINDLLNLSRMDSGAQQMDLELVNFNELVDYILDRFDMMVTGQEKNYRIVREFTERDLWVEIDTDKLMQVIDNIMNNAIKYSPDGGKITVRLMETHNNVVLGISDEGLGIPKKDLDKVFERFYRVDKARARQQGGTGLGLAISKEVMKAHNGQIWVESVEGKGSTFYISLPYEPYEEDIWE